MTGNQLAGTLVAGAAVYLVVVAILGWVFS